MYAMMILLVAVIIVVLLQIFHGIVPGQETREGNSISITQYNFGFSPNRLELRIDESVVLKVKSAGGDQIFAIDQFNIRETIKDQQEVSIPFVADKGGEFLFYDPTPGHNESGENGLLVVK